MRVEQQEVPTQRRMEQLEAMMDYFEPMDLLDSLVKAMSDDEANEIFKGIARVHGLPSEVRDMFR